MKMKNLLLLFLLSMAIGCNNNVENAQPDNTTVSLTDRWWSCASLNGHPELCYGARFYCHLDGTYDLSDGNLQHGIWYWKTTDRVFATQIGNLVKEFTIVGQISDTLTLDFVLNEECKYTH